MAAAKVTIKPYKLKPSGDKLSRDDVTTWKEVLLSHMRQNESWRQFLPGGGNQTWTAADDGVNVWLPDTLTRAQRTEIDVSFADFLTCLSPFSPAGFGETVKRESTSFTWVIDLVHDTFGLKTRGEHFLALGDLSFDFSNGFTYMQAYMEVKDFICSGLLEVGNRFEGKNVTSKETLSPGQ